MAAAEMRAACRRACRRPDGARRARSWRARDDAPCRPGQLMTPRRGRPHFHIVLPPVSSPTRATLFDCRGPADCALWGGGPPHHAPASGRGHPATPGRGDIVHFGDSMPDNVHCAEPSRLSVPLSHARSPGRAPLVCLLLSRAIWRRRAVRLALRLAGHHKGGEEGEERRENGSEGDAGQHATRRGHHVALPCEVAKAAQHLKVCAGRRRVTQA